MKSWKSILMLTIGLTAILAIMMVAFSLPAVNSGINDVPIGVVTPNKEAYQKIAKPLEEKGFKVSPYSDASQVKKSMTERYIYGAIGIDDSGNLTVYKATAASAAVSQLLTQLVIRLLNSKKQWD